MLAQCALFDFVRAARLVWSGLVELAGLVPDGELHDGALAAAPEAVSDAPRLVGAIDALLRTEGRRGQLHRLVVELLD